MPSFIEPLEDRTLMSATVVLHAAVSATIAADQAAVVDARQKIRVDTISYSASVREAQVNVKVARSQDLATIAAARRQYKLDLGNPTARAADLGMIQVDQAKLRTDVVAANQAVVAAHGNQKIALADDHAALKAAQTQLRRDRLLHL